MLASAAAWALIIINTANGTRWPRNARQFRAKAQSKITRIYTIRVHTSYRDLATRHPIRFHFFHQHASTSLWNATAEWMAMAHSTHTTHGPAPLIKTSISTPTISNDPCISPSSPLPSSRQFVCDVVTRVEQMLQRCTHKFVCLWQMREEEILCITKRNKKLPSIKYRMHSCWSWPKGLRESVGWNWVETKRWRNEKNAIPFLWPHN